MQQLTERIGLARSLQVAIEGWNEILLVILILTMVTGIRQDRSRKNKQSVSIPLTKELTVYFMAVLLYNLCDIIDIIAGGDPSKLSYYAIRAGVFLYYAVGGFQTVFFLQVIKEHISKKLGKKRISAVMTCFQAAHIPLFILLLSTPFTGALYSITDENIYVRSWGYMVWQTVTILSFICIAAVIISQWRSIGYFLKNIIAVAAFFPALGLIISLCVDTNASLNNIMAVVTALVTFVLYEKNKTDVTVQNALELEKSKQELEQSKIRLLVAQIQPHFIYNSLMALQAKSIENPEVYKGIKNFGDYLRSNFTAMTDNEMIPFEDELKSIKAYLQLEKLNFGDKMKVSYDIEINQFMLPALSVEPLVENAVRYGIGTYEKGGKVRISVRDLPDCIEIEVKDDGSGGNKLTDAQKKRKSIGLENVRLRLKASDMGVLDITQDETGTSAVIRLKNVEV